MPPDFSGWHLSSQGINPLLRSSRNTRLFLIHIAVVATTPVFYCSIEKQNARYEGNKTEHSWMDEADIHA